MLCNSVALLWLVTSHVCMCVPAPCCKACAALFIKMFLMIGESALKNNQRATKQKNNHPSTQSTKQPIEQPTTKLKQLAIQIQLVNKQPRNQASNQQSRQNHTTNQVDWLGVAAVCLASRFVRQQQKQQHKTHTTNKTIKTQGQQQHEHQQRQRSDQQNKPAI